MCTEVAVISEMRTFDGAYGSSDIWEFQMNELNSIDDQIAIESVSFRAQVEWTKKERDRKEEM
jgi:hypothetical protein